MRVGAISDTHSMLPSVAETLELQLDCIIHAGDIGPDRGIRDWWYDKFYPWVKAVKVPVFATFGNHDHESLASNPLYPMPENFKLLFDAEAEIGSQRVWFSPWSPLYGSWFWMAPEDILAKKYARIPEEIDIIVSHTPPYGVGDSLGEDALKYGLNLGHHVGSHALAARLNQLPNIKKVICGHIHESRGIHDFQVGHEFIDIYNVASVDGLYRPLKERFTIIEWD
jgi:Icc-related predicted phosphoesterase